MRRVGTKADNNSFLPSSFGRILIFLLHLAVLLFLDPSFLFRRLISVGCRPTITLGFGAILIHSRKAL